MNNHISDADFSQETNEKNIPVPNFFVVIPSHILDDPNIDDSTAILYGRIVSLSNNKGYCYASDKYLAELTNVSDREIRNRIQTLEENNYIVKETKKEGMVWHRKLYPNFNYERNRCSASKGMSVPIERNRCSEEQYKNKHNKNTTTRPNPKIAPVEDDAKKVVVSQCLNQVQISENKKLAIERDYSPLEIETAVQRVLRWRNRKSDEAAIMWVLEHPDEWNDFITKEEREENNAQLLEKIRHLDGKTFGSIYYCVGKDYFEYHGGVDTKHFKITDSDFEEKILQTMKFLNIKNE